MSKFKEIATKYFANDVLSLPLIAKDKSPVVKWKDKVFPREKYSLDIFNKYHDGIGVMTGYRSLGLEVLDVDLKHSSRPFELHFELTDAISKNLPEFYENCTITTTPSGGYHFYYRTEVLEGSDKLAYEKNPDPSAKKKYLVIIETRGEGGQAVTYPTPGYEIQQGGLDKPLYVLSTEDRETLFTICRSFCEKIEDESKVECKKTSEARQYKSGGNYHDWLTNPWADYNNSVSESEVISMIEDAGFKRTRGSGDKRIYFKRIGSTNTQGGNYRTDLKVFYPFTDNSLLESEKGYDPAGLLTTLRFGGDKKECYKWLVSAGYGVKLKNAAVSYIQPSGAPINGNPVNSTFNGNEAHQAQINPVPDAVMVNQDATRPTQPAEAQVLGPEDLARLLAEHEIKVTDKIDPPKPAWVQLTDGGERMMGTLGNFSLLIGKAKAKKSFLIAIVLAVALSSEILMGLFRGCLPKEKRVVLYFDTEQGRYHVQSAVKRICRMIGVSEPDNLKVYGLRSLGPAERLAMIDHAINTTENLGFVAIDGNRDLVTSINDEDQASMIATKLLRWTEERQIHIVTVLHQNKGDNNARGHLGSELVNKAETTLSVTKNAQEPDISIVEAEYCRNIDPEPFAFEIIDGLPSIVENYELRTETSKNQFDLSDLPPAEIYSMLNIVFSRGKEYYHGELVVQIKIAFKEKFGKAIGTNRVKELITFCKTRGWVKHEKARAPYTQGEFEKFDET